MQIGIDSFVAVVPDTLTDAESQLGGRTIWFRLNGYVETDVHNRPSGIKVTSASPKCC